MGYNKHVTQVIMENEEKITQEQIRPYFYKKEIVVNGACIVILSVVLTLLSLAFKLTGKIYSFPYQDTVLSFDSSIVVPSIVFPIVSNLALLCLNYFVKTGDQLIPSFKKLSNTICLILLYIVGILCQFVLMVLMAQVNINVHLAYFIASFIELCYFYLMIKLYLFNYVEDKRILFEVIRFALVGVLASIVDFVTCYLFQFIFLPDSWPNLAITSISVTCGFIVGVTVNYLCSIYMVFKATTEKDKSRTMLGKVMFVALSAVGLFIGIGLQALLYDVLNLDYILTFILRTIVTLFWNYFSRKYLIFR